MAASVMFMATNNALLTKYLVVQAFEKQVLVSEASFVDRKSLSFEISRYLLASHEA